jgi:curved DNA-binding protein CbpA
MDPRKHYKILEIERSASLEEARQAYRDLIAVWHPDRYTHNPRLQKKALEKVKAVNAAFEYVSRFILENGSEKEGPSEANGRTAPATARKKTEAADNLDRAAVWEKTEARLAALARARELAQAREALQAREAARWVKVGKKRPPASKKSGLEAENRVRARDKETTEKGHLEKRLAREKAWAETEQKLRALKLAREKAALARAGSHPRRKESREPVGWYVKQVLISVGILLIAFSSNALQPFIHISFTAMLTMIGGGFLTWWGVAKIMGRKRLRNKGE